MLKKYTLALAALAVGAAASPACAQAPLTYSTWVPPQHHISLWQANWASEIEKATGGRVKFQGLPKAPSAPPGTFDAVKDGLVDLSFVTASYTPARHILPIMAELPGAADTSVANSIAYSRMHWKHFQKVGEYNGVHLLGVWTHGPGQMFTKKPVKTLADFKGLKIRSGGGASGESFELLKSGVADGIFFPIESIVSFKLETVLGQATLFPGGLYSSSFGFFMNQDKWNKIAKPDQDIIEKHSKEYVARSAGRSWDEADRKGMEAMKKSEIKIVNADASLIKEVKALCAPIEIDWIQKASAKGIDAKAVLAEFRAELKKVANEK